MKNCMQLHYLATLPFDSVTQFVGPFCTSGTVQNRSGTIGHASELQPITAHAFELVANERRTIKRGHLVTLSVETIFKERQGTDKIEVRIDWKLLELVFRQMYTLFVAATLFNLKMLH